MPRTNWDRWFEIREKRWLEWEDHLSPGTAGGLPKRIDWFAVAETVHEIAARETLPPERVWAVGPDGQLRCELVGEDEAVRIPFEHLTTLYQAIFVHSHPPGRPPHTDDLRWSVFVCSPLLVVLEEENAHLRGEALGRSRTLRAARGTRLSLESES
ncbi:MAG: hypothetical protein N2Z82_03085 [Thermomicrobium sp.]|nr:hypothetical protein [Thermomicrobium sp.]